MIVGNFGDVIFETSDKKVLTYKNFRRDITSRFAVHEVIGKKPTSEFLAPNLDNVSFEVQVKTSLGYNPNDVIDQFIIYCRNGDIFPLVIGPKTIGVDKWSLSSVGVPVNTFGKNGEIVSASLELSFQEYVEGV